MSGFQGDLTVAGILVAIGNVQQENSSKIQAVLLYHEQQLRDIKQSLVDIKEMLSGTIKTSEDSEKSSSGSSLDMVIAKQEQAAGGVIATSTPVDSRFRDSDPDYVPEISGKLLEIICKDCGLTFVRGSGDFTRHVKETPCKPYQCYCGKLFKKNSSLTTHQATHLNGSFPCYCGAVFRCEQYLKNHERRQHSENEDPQDMTAKRPCHASPPETVLKKIETGSFNGKSMELLRLQMLEFEEPSEIEE